MITINQIQCKHCKDIIASEHRHDFKMCQCGKVGVDGGLDYLRRIGSKDDYIEMSAISDDEAVLKYLKDPEARKRMQPVLDYLKEK